MNNNYKVKCKGQDIDVYDVLKAFDVRCPATQHAVKKLLKAGQRGAKNKDQDLYEAIISLERARELNGLEKNVFSGKVDELTLEYINQRIGKNIDDE